MTNILVKDFYKGMYIFLRVVGVLFTTPFFDTRHFPNIARLGLALVITLILVMTLRDVEVEISDNFVFMIVLGMKEVLTGILMGFSLSFIFAGINFAGILIGQEIGLAMSQMFDPTSEENTNTIGMILMQVATIVFLLIDGHHYVIRALAYSFDLIPFGFFSVNDSVYTLLIRYSAGIFILAIKIASPIIVAFFLIHLGAAVIARTVPQMNIFFVMVPIKQLLGFFLLTLMIPIYIYVMRNLLSNYEDQLYELIKALNS